MDRHREVETVDHDKLDADWRGIINIEARYLQTRQELFDMLAKLEVMSD